MADKSKEKTEEEIEQEKISKQRKARPYVVVITIYFITLGAFLVYNLISLWPGTATASESSEIQMIQIVLSAGALGSLVHGFRSLFWYVGNRAFATSWSLMYFLLPFVGASLSLVFYFVLRGGLFSPQASINATSPFGFAGISGLVGMFSNNAALKLQEIADSIFTTKRLSTKGEDSVDPKKPDSIDEDKKDKKK